MLESLQYVKTVVEGVVRIHVKNGRFKNHFLNNKRNMIEQGQPPPPPPQQQQQQQRKKGYAPVKKEYLIVEQREDETNNDKKRSLDNSSDDSVSKVQKTEDEMKETIMAVSTNTTTTTTNTTTVTTNVTAIVDDNNNNNNKKKKKQRGENKGRTRANQTSFLKKNHNSSNGYDNNHNDDILLEREEMQKGEKNRLSYEHVKMLRKREYDFSKANEIVAHVEHYVRSDIRRQEKSDQNAKFQMLKIRARQVEQIEREALERGVEPEITIQQFYDSIQNVEDVRLLRLEYVETRHRPREVKRIDFRGKSVLAPLTTVGNLPFRRICKSFGVDITCGEMALASNILKGQVGELSLLRRHESEDCFGVQLAGSNADTLCKVAQLIEDQLPDINFVDINCGCPIDLLCNQGMGSGLLEKRSKLQSVIRSMKEILSVPLSVKTRTGLKDNKLIAHTLYPQLKEWGADILTLHGRTRQQRYTKEADWSYIGKCAALVRDEHLQVIGNGDVLSFEDFNAHIAHVDAVMIGRGALIKPWIFTEIKEQRHWDISANERLEILKSFVKYGYEHYGSDVYGIATTRRYLLEWLSFLHRYIPVGLLERLPQHINEKPPRYYGRNDLETLMASGHVQDWIKISNLIMPPPDKDFVFVPKHKSNSYEG
jgi:tRNA-dihydrouridine synthase 3